MAKSLVNGPKEQSWGLNLGLYGINSLLLTTVLSYFTEEISFPALNLTRVSWTLNLSMERWR